MRFCFCAAKIRDLHPLARLPLVTLSWSTLAEVTCSYLDGTPLKRTATRAVPITSPLLICWNAMGNFLLKRTMTLLRGMVRSLLVLSLRSPPFYILNLLSRLWGTTALPCISRKS